ncbi:MAG: 1-acyl-sn-glycerol-3-phosphate acyltransferase [Clostridiaceae bacterium]|nr:1-acyl-sn-glycerol-3-phosphate acyltransferase [Clostridiaceae bacterium]
MLYSIGKFLFRIYFTLFYRVKVEGTENIPKDGPLLMYANHPSAWDMILIACYMKRQIHFMAKVELFKNPIVALILRGLGAFPVNRGTGDIGSIRTVFKLLKKNKVVGVFPEGTRTPRKDLSKGKAGAAMLAVRSKAPVLPVGVEWNGRLFSKLRVVFGKPFVLESSKDDLTKKDLKEQTKMILNKIYVLIGQ